MPGELLAEKSQEQAGGGDGESETPAKEAPAASKPMVGIIYPPPEVRSIPPITFFLPCLVRKRGLLNKEVVAVL